MKSESLVIADQQAAVNTFPGLVHTARQTMKVTNTRSPIRRPKVGGMIGLTGGVYKTRERIHRNMLICDY